MLVLYQSSRVYTSNFEGNSDFVGRLRCNELARILVRSTKKNNIRKPLTLRSNSYLKEPYQGISETNHVISYSNSELLCSEKKKSRKDRPDTCKSEQSQTKKQTKRD